MNIEAPCGHLTSGSLYPMTIKMNERAEEGHVQSNQHKYVCADCLARVKGVFKETKKETVVSKVLRVIKGIFWS